MQTVEQILNHKGWGVVSAAPSTTLVEAMNLMVRGNVGALVVLEAERVLGTLSERDCVRRLRLSSLPLADITVGSLVNRRSMTVRLSDTVDHCIRVMTAGHIRYLPVLASWHCVGIVSLGDLVRAQLGQKESLIHDLESYIAGSPVNVERPPL